MFQIKYYRYGRRNLIISKNRGNAHKFKQIPLTRILSTSCFFIKRINKVQALTFYEENETLLSYPTTVLYTETRHMVKM